MTLIILLLIQKL